MEPPSDVKAKQKLNEILRWTVTISIQHILSVWSKYIFTQLKSLQQLAQNWTIVPKGFFVRKGGQQCKKVFRRPREGKRWSHGRVSYNSQRVATECSDWYCKDTVVRLRSQQLGIRPPQSLAMSYAGIRSLRQATCTIERKAKRGEVLPHEGHLQ